MCVTSGYCLCVSVCHRKEHIAGRFEVFSSFCLGVVRERGGGAFTNEAHKPPGKTAKTEHDPAAVLELMMLMIMYPKILIFLFQKDAFKKSEMNREERKKKK